jgi:hypothetical protein
VAQNLNHCATATRDIGTINIKNRIAATMYSLGTLFQEYIYINTLHKGDNDDDNNNNNDSSSSSSSIKKVKRSRYRPGVAQKVPES